MLELMMVHLLVVELERMKGLMLELKMVHLSVVELE